MSTILEIKHLKKYFETKAGLLHAVDDVSFSVEKGERDGRTYTRVERLDKQGRVEELARLIGGASLTPALIKSAEDLLQQAQEYRNSK